MLPLEDAAAPLRRIAAAAEAVAFPHLVVPTVADVFNDAAWLQRVRADLVQAHTVVIASYCYDNRELHKAL